MAKITLHIEADSPEEYFKLLSVVSYNARLEPTAIPVESTNTELKTDTGRTRRTKAEIAAEKAALEDAQNTGAKISEDAEAPAKMQEPVQVPVDAKKAVEKVLNLDDLRLLVFPLNKHSDDGKAAVKDIIMGFGVDSFSKIPEDKYQDAANQFKSLLIKFGLEIPF